MFKSMGLSSCSVLRAVTSRRVLDITLRSSVLYQTQRRQIQPLPRIRRLHTTLMYRKQDSPNVPEIQYNDVLRGIKNKNILLLDVRTPAEVAQGVIPTAKSLPVEEIEEALKLDESSFLKIYGFKKPLKNDKIVTYCKAGVRSMRAGNALHAQNYQNVSSYTGSWTEWSEKHPEDVKSS